MPFQSWELKPLGANHVKLTIVAAILEVEIEIKVSWNSPSFGSFSLDFSLILHSVVHYEKLPIDTNPDGLNGIEMWEAATPSRVAKRPGGKKGKWWYLRGNKWKSFENALHQKLQNITPFFKLCTLNRMEISQRGGMGVWEVGIISPGKTLSQGNNIQHWRVT